MQVQRQSALSLEKGGTILMSDVLYEAGDGIATIVLNRPDHMNTMGGELVQLAAAAMERAAADDSIRVLLLTGAGRAFCAGGDLRGFGASGAASAHQQDDLDASIA